MKIECDKSKVESVIQKVARLAGRHMTLPVLSCVYMETLEKNKLILKSTNLDVGIEVEVRVNVLEAGSVAVPANVLISVLSSIKDNELTLEVIDNNLKISSPKNSVIIKSIPHEDFPSIPKLTDGEKGDLKLLKINSKDLISGFKSVWYSASNSNIKPELSSVFINNDDNALVFVSTDSFRLAEKRVNTKISSEFPQTLIPYKNVSEIIKLFEDYDGEVSIIFDKNQAAFMIEGVYLVSRLVDGSFPDYKQIIPKSFETNVTILKNDLVNSIKGSNIFSDSLNQVKVKIDVKNKTFIVESKNNDVGEYKESIKVVAQGNDLELNFNNKFITECMQSISGESLLLSFGGSGKPLIIRGVSDKSFMYMVMPMNR